MLYPLNAKCTLLFLQDKYKLTTKLGIQTRDLRLLDPHFTATYPSCILCRDQSVVVNLEHIKVTITIPMKMKPSGFAVRVMTYLPFSPLMDGCLTGPRNPMLIHPYKYDYHDVHAIPC
jgi:hypothetical protein